MAKAAMRILFTRRHLLTFLTGVIYFSVLQCVSIIWADKLSFIDVYKPKAYGLAYAWSADWMHTLSQNRHKKDSD